MALEQFVSDIKRNLLEKGMSMSDIRRECVSHKIKDKIAAYVYMNAAGNRIINVSGIDGISVLMIEIKPDIMEEVDRLVVDKNKLFQTLLHV